MRAIIEQTKQNEQRLESMIAENERLLENFALEMVKSIQAARLISNRSPKVGGRQPRARQDTDSDFDSLSPEPRKKG